MSRIATGLGIALAVAGLSGVLVGCGGSAADKNVAVNPIDAAFIAKAEAICAPVLDYNASHPNPYPSFDYNHPDAATMKLEGAFFSASPFNAALAQLVALPAPQTNAPSWTALTTTAAALRTQSLKQNAAALAGDVTTFTATIAPISSLATMLQINAYQAGFADTSSCARLFSSG